MSAATDFAAAVQALAAAVQSAADDPADQVRVLAALAAFRPDAAGGPGGVGRGVAAAQGAVADLCRRAAVVALARASADYRPTSYDEAISLRDLVCGLLETESMTAAAQGQDATYGALRNLRAAVAQDLTTRAADLAHITTVTTPAPVPALVLAHRLYGDATRADELAGYAQAPSPVFLPTSFKALDR